MLLLFFSIEIFTVRHFNEVCCSREIDAAGYLVQEGWVVVSDMA